MSKASSIHSGIGLRSGACFPCHKMCDCEVVFVGDSQFRYLSEHIPKIVCGSVPAICFQSGAKVEDLCGDHVTQMFSQKTQVCVINLGTNNIKIPGIAPSTVVSKFQDVLSEIKRRSPKCEIFISSILPRSVDSWDRFTNLSTKMHKVQLLNRSIAQCNAQLSTLCNADAHLHFVNHDKVFWPNSQSVQSSLLARDGLHLSKRGISCVAKTLLESIEACQFRKCNVETSQPQATPSPTEPSDDVSQIGLHCHASIGSSEFPPLPKPSRLAVSGAGTPYTPADQSLVIAKADLHKLSPGAAILSRVKTNQITNYKSHKTVPQANPSCGRRPKVNQSSSAKIQTLKAHSTNSSKNKTTKTKAKAERSISVSNRFALLTVEDISSETATLLPCASTKLPSKTHNKIKRPKSMNFSFDSSVASDVPSSDSSTHVTSRIPVAPCSGMESGVSSERPQASASTTERTETSLTHSTTSECVDKSAKYSDFPFSIDTFSPINIKSTTNEEPILSNFFHCPITHSKYNCKIFKSVEHCYQYCCAKFFRDPDLAEEIYEASSASQAKTLSSRLKQRKRRMHHLADQWEMQKVELMTKLLETKAASCTQFKDRLIQTYPHPLIHNVFDGFWGTQDTSGNGGLNMFAELLMELRLKLILSCMVPSQSSHSYQEQPTEQPQGTSSSPLQLNEYHSPHPPQRASCQLSRKNQKQNAPSKPQQQLKQQQKPQDTITKPPPTSQQEQSFSYKYSKAVPPSKQQQKSQSPQSPITSQPPLSQEQLQQQKPSSSKPLDKPRPPKQPQKSYSMKPPITPQSPPSPQPQQQQKPHSLKPPISTPPSQQQQQQQQQHNPSPKPPYTPQLPPQLQPQKQKAQSHCKLANLSPTPMQQKPQSLKPSTIQSSPSPQQQPLSQPLKVPSSPMQQKTLSSPPPLQASCSSLGQQLKQLGPHQQSHKEHSTMQQRQHPLPSPQQTPKLSYQLTSTDVEHTNPTSCGTCNSLDNTKPTSALPSFNHSHSGLLSVMVRQDGTYTTFRNGLDDFHTGNKFDHLEVYKVKNISEINVEQSNISNSKCQKIQTKKAKILDRQFSKQSFRIKVFGKMTTLVANKEYITKHDIIEYVSTLKNTASFNLPKRFIIKCNGIEKYKKMFPHDSISVEIAGLLGGGKRKGIHSGQPCRKTCFICNSHENNYCHLSRRTDRPEFVSYVKSKYSSLKDDTCFCRRCEKSLMRQMTEQTPSSPPTKQQRLTECCAKKLGLSDCDDKLHKAQAEWDLETVAEALEIAGESVADTHVTHLCKKHYSRVYDYCKFRDRKCFGCRVRFHNKKAVVRRKYTVKFDFVQDQQLIDQLKNVAKDIFATSAEFTSESLFCNTCFKTFNNKVRENKVIFRNPIYHEALLRDILKCHVLEQLPDQLEWDVIENHAYNKLVHVVCKSFMSKRAVLMINVMKVYNTELKTLLEKRNIDISYLRKSKNSASILDSLNESFRQGIVSISRAENVGNIIAWAGYDSELCITNLLGDVLIEKSSYEEQVMEMKKNSDLAEKANKEKREQDVTKEDQMLEKAVHILRDEIDMDVGKMKAKISTNELDLRNIDFHDFVRTNVSPRVWNFLAYLSATKTSFDKIQAATMWSDLVVDKNFLKIFYVYSHILYAFSSGQCNQPLHMMLGDILDRFSNSSNQCLKIFNEFGIVPHSATLERFQTSVSENHIQNAPFNDINKYSFAYASLDNLDFLNKHARVSAGKVRCVNVTTYMAGQPKPNGLKWKEDENTGNQMVDKGNKNRPRKRKVDEPAVLASPVNFHVLNDHTAAVTLGDFKPTSNELEASRLLHEECFVYNVIKSSRNGDASCDKFYPYLKAFLARKDKSEVEPSSKSYLGVLNERCDSKNTVKIVLDNLYEKMNVGKTVNHLVVVGDGKTFDHLVDIKKEDEQQYSWMLPFIGDWHILKNYALTLMKIYGEAGLYDLLKLMHKGRTENCVVNSTDFDKTLEFILQVWEAMYRIQIKMFLEAKQNSNGEIAAPSFSEEQFLSRIADMTQCWLEMNHDQDEYEAAFLSASSELKDSQKEFQEYCEQMSATNPSFRFWNRFIHVDCFAYVQLYLAGRSGNWNLRVHAIKQMIPMFHVSQSQYYFKLLPQHIADLVRYPQYIKEYLQSGGFVMSQTGSPWSSLSLDEMHERSINKELKGTVKSLSSASMINKLHYLSYRASMHSHMLETINPPQNKKRISKDNIAYSKLYEENVAAYQNKLKDSVLYKSKSSTVFQHLFSGKIASDSTYSDLMNMREVGVERLSKHVKCFITHEESMRVGQTRAYKYTALKNFGDNNKSTKRNLGEEYYKSKAELQAKILSWCHDMDIPPDELDQFISLPLAISNSEGLPVSQGKSNLMKHWKEQFAEAFSTIKTANGKILIIDAMIILYLNSPHHNTFGEYAKYLFQKYVTEKLRYEKYTEIHVCFDRQHKDIETPKVIERERRDKLKVSENIFTKIEKSTHIPCVQWPSFLANRDNKQQVIEFICDFFIAYGQSILREGQTLIVSGGFPLIDGKNIAKIVSPSSFCSTDQDPIVLSYCNNHVEGDSLVWLHATSCDHDGSPITILSSDTDIPQIGLSMLDKYPDRHFIIQYKQGPVQAEFLDMRILMSLLSKNTDLKVLSPCDIGPELQALYACTGCDYVSFFKYYSKASFYNVYFDNVKFISSSDVYRGSLIQTDANNWKAGFLAFCRLVGSMYMKRCASLLQIKFDFKKKPSPEELYKKLQEANPGRSHTRITELWLNEIRIVGRMAKRNKSEEYWLPSFDSLRLHWQRACYVVQIWKQCNQRQIIYPSLSDWGWTYVENKLEFKWDSKSNIQRIENYKKLWSNGCHCKALQPCVNMRCGCKRSGKTCGPGCECRTEVCGNKPLDASIAALLSELGGEAELIEEQVVTDDESASENEDYESDDETA